MLATVCDLPDEAGLLNPPRRRLNQNHAASAQNRQGGHNGIVFWLLLGVLVLAASSISAQQLVQNGGFETGDFTDWTLTVNPANTVVSTNSLCVHSGNYGAELGAHNTPGYLSQTIATVPGQSYLLSFWLDSPDGLTPNVFVVSWNGTNLFDQTNLPALGWTNMQYIVSATSTSTVLRFGFEDDNSNLGLDDVSLTPELDQNGGFESGDFTDWTLSGNTKHTVVSTNSLYVHSGNYGAELGPHNTPGYLSQTIPTIPAQSYLLSFWLDSPDGEAPNIFLVSWNGTNLFDQTNLPALGWTNLQYVVIATSSNTLLQFRYQDDPSNLGLDDISITAISGQPLQNGGFETGNFQGWTQLGNTAHTLVSTNPLYVHSGVYGAQLGPDLTPGFLFQNVATTPGQSYLLSLWLDSPDGLAGDFFLVSWNGTNIFSQTNLPGFGWTNLQFNVTATNAATVLQFEFQDDKSYLGLDDVSLTPIIPPSLSSPVISANGTFGLTLNATPGSEFAIEAATNLSQPQWIPLATNVTDTNGLWIFIDTSSTNESQRFYRALEVQ